MTTYPPIDIVAHWADANEHLIDLAGAVPADKWNWSPEPRFWNFRGIFLHIIAARYYTTRDDEVPDFWRLGQTTEGVKEHLRLSWEALSGFLMDPAALDGPDPLIDEPPDPMFSGRDYRHPAVRAMGTTSPGIAWSTTFIIVPISCTTWISCVSICRASLVARRCSRAESVS